MMHDTDGQQVVIAGAGPVGLTVALALAQQGITVTVLEGGTDLSTNSRASTVHASTLELCDDLGVAWDIIRAGEIIPRVQYRERKLGPIAEFDFGLMSDYTAFPIRMQTDQARIVRIMARKLAECPSARILFGHEVRTVRQDGGVVFTTADTAGGEVVFESTYAAGCDGAHSAVRAALGLQFEGEAYEIRLLKILTTFDVLGAVPDLLSATYVFDDDEPFGVLCLPDHTRVTFHLKPPEDADEVVLPEKVQARLERALGAPAGTYPVASVLVYSLHRRLATAFRLENAFLAGDAAHLNHPAGGMGMNSGMHDGYLLGKALADVLGGHASDAALTGYAETRRAVAAGYVHSRSDRNATDMRSKQEMNDERDARLRRIAADPALARGFVLRASMFDSAPRRLW